MSDRGTPIPPPSALFSVALALLRDAGNPGIWLDGREACYCQDGLLDGPHTRFCDERAA